MMVGLLVDYLADPMYNLRFLSPQAVTGSFSYGYALCRRLRWLLWVAFCKDNTVKIMEIPYSPLDNLEIYEN